MASAVSGKVGEDIIKGKGVLHFVIFFNEVQTFVAIQITIRLCIGEWVHGGEIANYCICGYSFAEVIDPVEHTWGIWFTVVEPTYTTAGTEEHICEICNTSETRDLPTNTVEEEIARLEKELDKWNKEVRRVQGKLSNAKFVNNAPEKIVLEEKAKEAEYLEKQATVSDRIAVLKQKFL